MGKVVKNIVRYMSILVCLVLSIGLFSACSLGGKKEDNTYAVTGYVFDEFGAPVEGVLISSDISSATTDKDGKYVISGIKNSIILSPSKEGYKFDEISRMITSSNEDANFLAYKEYQITGVAHNNGVALSNANVIVDSLSGTFYTITDENGQFVVSGVAGESTVNCEVDSLQFYEVKTTIDNPTVQIITTSSLTLDFEFDTEEVDYSKIELFVNGEKLTLSSSKKVIEDINCGAVVELKSTEYHFNRPAKFIVSSLNQVEKFSCSKIYSITGSVKSGLTPLSNASLILDGKLLSYVGENGNFSVGGLYGEHTLSVEVVGFVFDSKKISKDLVNVDFVGTKAVIVNFDYDFENDEDFDFGEVDAEKVSAYEYKLSGVELGEVVEVSSSKYYLQNAEITVGEDSTYTLEAKAYYNANIVVAELDNAEFVLDGNVVSADALSGLYGEHTVSAKYEDYIFSSCLVNFEHTEASLTYVIPYSVIVKVVSGELDLVNADVTVGESSFKTDAEAKVVLNGLILSNTIVASANGYNSAEAEVTAAGEITIDLSYDICGYVKIGNVPVISAEVTADSETCLTDVEGYFEIEGLYGENLLEIQKESYVFADKTITMHENLNITGTYNISGNVSIEGAPIEGYVVHLRDIEQGNEETVLTDEDGNYSFSDLNKTYFLYVTNTSGAVELKPVSYTLTGAGRYNFSSSGYSVSGYIKTGNVPIANVKVVAGSESVYTDAEGYYHFELLTQECSIYAEKDGYVFSGAIDVADNKEDANFSATYEVKGKVIVDSVPVAGVKVTIGGVVVYTNEKGEYSLAGVEGEVPVSFEKEGYEFTSSGIVSGDGEIEISSKVVSTAIVKTGDIQIFDYECYIGSEKQVVENGIAKFTATKGTVVTFVKNGYVIESITVTEPKLYETTASYTISGRVLSGSISIARAYVYVDEKQVATTNSNGEFTVSGLAGIETITFAKTGFVIGEVNVNGATNSVVANATFKVYGTVSVGARTLEGVKVTCGTEEFTTLADGKFEFAAISGTYGLTFEKQGYTFEEIASDKFGEQRFLVEAKYSISGFVKTGNVAIEGATIVATLESTGEDIETISGADGSFTIEGISGLADIIVSKEGYISATILGFSDASTNVSVNLKYNVTIKFNVTGVAVYVNGNKQIVTTNTVSLTGLQGENTLRFELANTAFLHGGIQVQTMKVNKPSTIEITGIKSYSIHGYVKTDKNLPLSNVVVVSNSGQEVVTNSDGYYEYPNIAGSVTLKNATIRNETKNITADGEYNFTVSNNDFAYMLYEEGYKNLDAAASVQIYGTGAVVGDAGITKTTQYVYSIFKRDNNGNILKQNLNYGETVFGVDPKVSLVTYLQNGSNVVKYQQLEDGQVTGKTEANHNISNFSSISPADYKTKYGEGIYDYSPYDITKSKITGYSTVTMNGSGDYEFELSISTLQPGYKTRVIALSGVEFPSDTFITIKLKFKVSKTGWIKQVDAHDEYKIKQGVDVSINSNVSYVYHTNKPNLKIDDMKFDTTEDLKNSLKKSSQTELSVSSVSATNYACGDIVSQVIYGK